MLRVTESIKLLTSSLTCNLHLAFDCVFYFFAVLCVDVVISLFVHSSRVFLSHVLALLSVGYSTQAAVLAVSFSSDSHTLVSASRDHELLFWNAATGARLDGSTVADVEVCEL